MDLYLSGTLAASRPAVGVASGSVLPYLGGRRSPAWDRIASRASHVVVRGSSGAAWLREGAHHGGLIDPATYEKRDDAEQLEPRLPFSDDPAADAWLDRQRNARAVGLLAPGVWVPHRDRSVAAQHLERVNHLRDTSGDEVVAVLALDSRWLVDGTDEILRVLNGGGPLALILGDANDPLERRGAVRGLVEIIGELGPQLMVMRCDVGAIGAVACGARLGSIGTTTGVRHVVPPGKGWRRNNFPDWWGREATWE